LAGSALIIGGGIAGISAALELNQRGINASIIESQPILGGHAANYCCKATDQCHKCYACLVADRINQIKQSGKTSIYTRSELNSIQANTSSLTAAVTTRARHIDNDKCISCGLCAEVCPQNCIQMPNPRAVPQEYVVDTARCLNYLGEHCDICVKACPTVAIDMALEPEHRRIVADALVLATGFEPYDPIQKGTFGYSKFPNVISAMDLESLLAENSTSGLKLPSNGEIAGKVAFIQCVGSRYDRVEDDSNTNIYCSRICCGYALRMANLILDRAPDTTITVFFMDLQHFGKNFDEFVDKCSNNPNFEFIRGIPAKAQSRNDSIELVYEDFTGGGVKTKSFDAVVLSVGMRPREQNRALAEMLDIGLDRFGFFAGDNSSSVSTSSERVFRVGSCSGPKHIGECVNEAATVAEEIAQLLERY